MAVFSVIIPAYNEEDGIREISERVLSIEPSLSEIGIEKLELIIVDDGSSDRTAEIVSTIPGATLLRHTYNSGYGAALKTGFAAASGEWLGFLDADGTYPPEYFPALLSAAMSQKADLVIGSRMAGAESQMPATRRLGNIIFANLVSIISATKITDSASGMRVFKQSLLPKIYPLPDGLNLTPVMSTRALHEQVKMVEVPIPYSERVGRSKLSVVRDGMRFGQSIIWTALNYNPARLFGLIGICLIALAGLVGAILVLLRLQGVQTINSLGAFVIFSSVIFAVAGVSMVTLGLGFNYFVALFHKTPVRQGLWGKSTPTNRWSNSLGWLGLGTLAIGILLATGSLIFALQGATVTQLWLYYLASACFALIGIQLIVSWIQMQVLDALRLRDNLSALDLQGKEVSNSATSVQLKVANVEIQKSLQPQS